MPQLPAPPSARMPKRPATGPAQRRRLLAAALAAPLAAALGACGFRLRQAPDFAFDKLVLAMPASPLGTELRRQLEGTGRITVLAPDAPGAAQADLVLHSSGEQRERTVLSLNSSGEVREFQLRIAFGFSLSKPDGRELLPATEVARQIDQSYSESAALSKDQEADMLYQSLQSDIVQQVMRRLATLKP